MLTADEFQVIPDDESMQTELDEGEVVRIPWRSLEHGDLEVELLARISEFAKPRALGRVYPGNTGFRLSDDTVRCPDVAFVRGERVESVRSKGFARGVPDLAVEIFSPSDNVRQLMRKVKQYLAAGCHTVWIFYPESKELHVLDATGADRLLTIDDTLDAPELLPGFTVRVGELFE
ncbi:MAG TPA: Uma2 family endonuclease [Bryobacteraceae bacterium]|jgi:Uma2 family endonuclease